MNPSLIYVIGASGSGKDSLMSYAREKLAAEPGICFAHRYITRPADAGGENHIALTVEEFDVRRRAKLFALHWQSHGLHYGIGIEINQWLAKQQTVVINGSREYLPVARQLYPELIPVHIEVPEGMLRERLLARGREMPAQVEQRLMHHRQLRSLAASALQIHNDGTLDVAGELLLDLIRQRAGSAACA